MRGHIEWRIRGLERNSEGFEGRTQKKPAKFKCHEPFTIPLQYGRKGRHQPISRSNRFFQVKSLVTIVRGYYSPHRWGK